MKLLYIALFGLCVIFTTSCESCYTCTYDASQPNIVDSSTLADTAVYEAERCGPNYDVKDFVDQQEQIGWECKKQ